ncbi:hypothetical protein EHQ53_14015 [Leptospira langatensis]|uniref:Uncharacterized protein n=1 Tax=Leptospira langatensis TaxID=2484983 RepID=A0ABY2M993_9LEPT|nr:hypothetical protein EHQ53_14015 [Leptospira langatensis]
MADGTSIDGGSGSNLDNKPVNIAPQSKAEQMIKVFSKVNYTIEIEVEKNKALVFPPYSETEIPERYKSILGTYRGILE